VPPPIAVCLGSAAEALTLAPVVHALRRADAPHVVVATGRPTRMLDDMLATFAIAPEIDLRTVARADANVGAVGRALGFARPAAVVVAADGATALGATPAAFSRGIPVAQVGTGGPAAAFASAGERRLLGHLATWRFVPDEAAREELIADGADPATVEVAGGLVAEAVRGLAEGEGLLARRALAGPRRVLVALRRGGGRDDADGATGATLARLAERADVEIAIAAPRSPLLRGALAAHENVRLLACPRYASFVAALATSHLLLSDAPATLEAAAALGVPSVFAGDPEAARRDAERALDDETLPWPLRVLPAGETLHRPLRLLPAADAAHAAAARIVARVTSPPSATVADVHSARLAA
jgi:UDP-N-acetylglucosamine 2-epimerase (non-hydrolysing)